MIPLLFLLLFLPCNFPVGICLRVRFLRKGDNFPGLLALGFRDVTVAVAVTVAVGVVALAFSRCRSSGLGVVFNRRVLVARWRFRLCLLQTTVTIAVRGRWRR